MTDDLMAAFAQMQHYTAALHRLIATAQEQAPRRSEGTDDSGAVRVELGADGLPTAFQVDRDWERMLEPEAFGAAVVQACQAAMGDRLSAWSTSLQDSGWQDGANRLRGGPQAQPATPPTRVPPAFRRPVPEVTPRPLGQLTEDVLAAFDGVGDFAAPRPGASTGSGGGGKLTITLSTTGLSSCTADPTWVDAQTSARLMNALSEALAEAKSKLDRTPPASPEPPGMDRLLAEAMALLKDPRRLAD